MKSNLKVILSATAVAVLLASPAMASKAGHHSTARHFAPPATAYVPNNAYGFVGPNNAYGFEGESLSERWRATHSGSWDATHDPRENPQF